MKKCLLMILTLTAVVGLVGCGKESVGDPPTVNGQDYFNASVTQVNDNFILAEVTENVSGAISVGTEVSISNKNISSEEFPELEVGDIVTTEDKLADSEVSVLLYSIVDGEEQFIGTSTLSSEENHGKIIFSNLTSACKYKIGVSARNLAESVTIIISEE